MLHKAFLDVINQVLSHTYTPPPLQHQQLDQRPLFGGKMLILAEDFLQLAPIVKGGDRFRIVNASVVSSRLWESFIKRQLKENLRSTDEMFSTYLDNVGKGIDDLGRSWDSFHVVDIPASIAMTTSVQDAYEFFLPNSVPNDNNRFVAYLHSQLKSHNATLLGTLSVLNDCEIVDCLSADEVVEKGDTYDDIIADVTYLNVVDENNAPPHCLQLFVGCCVTVLRNLDLAQGLVNGVLLTVTNIFRSQQLLECRRADNKKFLLPRIMFAISTSTFKFNRRQFPVRLAYATTVNKAQGMTITKGNRIVVDCRSTPFLHAQLFVALSRAKNPSQILILTTEDLFQFRKAISLTFKEFVEAATIQ